MKKVLQIPIDCLRGEEPYTLTESLPSTFIEQEEDEIRFQKPIEVEISAYISGEFLILDCSISTEILIPCSFCNEYYPLQLSLTHYQEEEPLENIKGHLFDASEVIREAILLEIPLYPLCGGVVCNNRATIEPYLTKSTEEEE